MIIIHMNYLNIKKTNELYIIKLRNELCNIKCISGLYGAKIINR